MSKNIIYSCLTLAVLLLCAACEKEDNWQPGKAVAEGTPVVYFSSDNSATIINLGEESGSFNLILERTDTIGELTVPIVVNNMSGEMDVPSTATFQDGESQTKLKVNYKYSSGMTLSLSIGAGYGNPYLEQDGSLSYMCSIARLNRICKVKYRKDDTYDSKLSEVESYIYSYEGINRFVFSNFMDSGIDVTFTVDTKHTGVTFDPENIRSLKGDFTPLDNNYYDGGGWYLYDEKTDDYPSWVPTGDKEYWKSDKPVLYFYYYGYSEDNNYSYSYIDFSNKSYSRFWGAMFYFDEDFEDYVSPPLYYSFDFNAQ